MTYAFYPPPKKKNKNKEVNPVQLKVHRASLFIYGKKKKKIKVGHFKNVFKTSKDCKRLTRVHLIHVKVSSCSYNTFFL